MNEDEKPIRQILNYTDELIKIAKLLGFHVGKYYFSKTYVSSIG